MARNLKALLLSGADGTVAVEFALIAPVLISIFFAVAELTNALQASSKVTSLASSAADLIAQEKSVCNAEMTNVFSAISAIMFPFPSAGTQIRISSITDNGNGTANVVWSDAQNTSPRAVGSSIPGLPPGVIAAGGSAIYAEVIYSYNSASGKFLTSVIPMQSNFYARPRQVTQVARTVSAC
jgi:Flp pilus assembly protein TadG